MIFQRNVVDGLWRDRCRLNPTIQEFLIKIDGPILERWHTDTEQIKF